MSVARKAFKQGSWLAFFKFLTQVLSWASTIIVARLLVPDDYGLMAMATILTGYAALFSEMGLGAAIIQRPNATEQELSSVFWFALGISLLFATICFPLAYFTAYIFHEPRLIPLTQAVSVIFLINGLQIVPFNLIKKQLEFKNVGIIEMAGSLVSCAFMIGLAYLGAGVWTLLLGHIIRSFTNLILVFYFATWAPTINFNFVQLKSFLGFGIVVAMSRTFTYIFARSDKFFAGRAWPPKVLGYYTFALQLAQVPTEKIVSLIDQVSFSVFSELKDNKEAFKEFYLKVTKVIAMCVLPLFLCGFLLGEDLIKVFLDDKWLPIVFLFKMLCLSQFFMALSTINNWVHVAQGRPRWSMYFSGSQAFAMGISFFMAAQPQHTLNAMLIPWLLVFPCICLGFIIITLKKIGIGLIRFIKNLHVPLSATFFMALAVYLADLSFPGIGSSSSQLLMLIFKIVLGAFTYLGTTFFLDSDFLKKAYNILKAKDISNESS